MYVLNKKVLVMEYCEGFSIRNFNKIIERNINRSILLDRICTAWAIQVTIH